MTWGIVVMEHPFVCSAWSHSNDPFSELFKDVYIKNLVDSLSWRNKFCVDDSPSFKNKSALSHYFFCHTSYNENSLFRLTVFGS